MALPKLLQKLFQNNGAGDKLNQDIIPDIPYSKVTDAPSVDSALSSTSENPVQNKVINSALDGKLSLTGGTMTGDIQFTNGDIWFNKQAFHIRGGANDTYLEICPGTTSEFVSKTGASLMMAGRDYTGNSIPKGCFYLTAASEAEGHKSFAGTPDGSLTWGGHNVITVVAESYSANSWYRKYSDGWIEQGGYSTGNSYTSPATLTFPTAFSSNQYTIIGCGFFNDLLNHSVNIYFGARTATSVRAVSAFNGSQDEPKPFMWFACGK